MNPVLKKYEKCELAELNSEELTEYRTALAEQAGLYIRAYRVTNARLRATEQEIERRKHG